MPDDRVRVASLLRALDARAAGIWKLRGERLERAAFVAAPDLDPGVADAFARATESVPLDQAGLGIVRAAVGGIVAVSVAADLPPDAGSGRWLRAFGAARSVAVPLLDPEGHVEAVLSVALPEDGPDDRRALELIRTS